MTHAYKHVLTLLLSLLLSLSLLPFLTGIFSLARVCARSVALSLEPLSLSLSHPLLVSRARVRVPSLYGSRFVAFSLAVSLSLLLPLSPSLTLSPTHPHTYTHTSNTGKGAGHKVRELVVRVR